MMSAERRTDVEAPFGYTFESPNPGVSNSSYPPPGPQLLDNNELGYLESFFEDPSNVDSNIPSFSGEYTGDSANMFNNPGTEWANQGLSNMSNPGMSVTQGPGHMPSQPEQSREIPASADVYAAAGILHGNTVRQLPTSYNGYSVGFGSAGTDGSQMNGYAYGSMQDGQGGDYNFDTGNNGFYDDYDARDSSNPYVTGLQSRLQGWNAGRPSGPLNFGSDDGFRSSTYAARTSEAPDKDLVAAVNHNFGRERDSKSRRKGRQGGSTEARKRPRPRRTEIDVAVEHDVAETAEEGESPLKRRRKSKAKEEEEEDDDDDDDDYEGGFEDRTAKGTKTKKKQGSSAQPDGLDSNIADKTHSTSGAASAKERRENLTEEQKRNNHIQSEQKRRNLIKKGFEDLNRMVPELRSSGQSKSNMLLFAAAFMRELRDKNEELKAQIDALDNG